MLTDFDHILNQFYQGINWNLYLYITYKLASTIVTLALFNHLQTEHFAAWANSLSVIYLALLWADFGLRKSLPRYYHEFARNNQAIKHFLCHIILFEAAVLACLLPILMIASSKIISAFGIADTFIIYAIPAIFAIEGMVSIVRIIYHAHFWQKSFNILYAIITTIETITNLICIVTIKQSLTLLKSILITKLIAGTIILSCGLLLLKKFYAHQQQVNQEPIDYPTIMKEFIKHSVIMWSNTTLRSFSERNFMMPLLTIIVGAQSANIFKIANDGAIIFQRIILKAIGTTDTSLLAYVDTLPEKKNLTNVAFQKLSAKIATLCLPLLGIIGLCIGLAPYPLRNSRGFQLFYIIAISYVLESMLLPFERLLEVKKRYWYLVSVYVFYLIAVCTLLGALYVSWIGLGIFILFVCIVRLVSLLIMSLAGYRLFGLSIFYQSYTSFISLTAKTIGIALGAYALFIQIPRMQSGLYSLARVVMKTH